MATTHHSTLSSRTRRKQDTDATSRLLLLVGAKIPGGSTSAHFVGHKVSHRQPPTRIVRFVYGRYYGGFQGRVGELRIRLPRGRVAGIILLD